MHSFLGIEIGGTKLQLLLTDADANPGERRAFAVTAAHGAGGIRRQLEEALPALLQNQPLRAVGLGFGGPVDWKCGKASRSHQIEGWSDFALAAWLQELTGAPVSIDNDANVAALGEARRGAGRGSNPVFYATLGSGVGGGLVVDGRIYHGAPPGEAELGHLRLAPNGPSVESRCSGWAVDARIRELKTTAPQSVLGRLACGAASGEAKFLAPALEQGDPYARKILDDTGQDLAFALSHVVHLFHPQIIILGGGLSKVGEPLRAAVELALNPLVMKAFRPAPRVVLAALGDAAVPVGAIELARQSVA